MKGGGMVLEEIQPGGIPGDIREPLRGIAKPDRRRRHALVLWLCLPACASLFFSCRSGLLRSGRIPPFRTAGEYALSRLRKSLDEIPPNQFPIRTRGTAEWELTSSSAWTSGFFPGCLWLAFRLSGDSSWIAPARRKTGELANEQFNRGTHDIGFMIFDSYGKGYESTGDESYRPVLLRAAESLASRFNRRVGCIQSWNGDFQVIIDNLMNLEILFWAAAHGGDPALRSMAVSHADKTIANHLRPDGSAFHVVVYDTATGAVREKRTAQGCSAASAWARGQAWGIYGFTVCYRETRNPAYLDAAVRMADYFLEHLPEDHVPFWDFNLPADDSRRYKDASAAAIAASGLLELRGYVEDPGRYDAAVRDMLGSLAERYLSRGTRSSGILLHAAYNANSRNPFDRDASTVWGDYYFLEALLRYEKLHGGI
jgi:unsaturated chondroitin disaccharide hydrolase